MAGGPQVDRPCHSSVPTGPLTDPLTPGEGNLRLAGHKLADKTIHRAMNQPINVIKLQKMLIKNFGTIKLNFLDASIKRIPA